jgi:glutamate N-acetyltransferase/amino-acid N-acetyltransferase
MITNIEGGITAPKGFRASGAACGIKKNGRLDVALVVSDQPAATAGAFTTNLAVAAPVIVSREHLTSSGGHGRAIVTNSGCANACTGQAGLEGARLMAAQTSRLIGCDPEEVLVASTGVIGVSLDTMKVTKGIIAAFERLSVAGHADAAQGIMTTDPFPKEAAVRVDTAEGTFRVGGMAKGSGMIEPRLATMLGYLTTDARVEPDRLKRALTEACEDTFNAITVDGEPSTNDSVFAIANGVSGVNIGDALHDLFVQALRTVARELALGIVRGGEGATKLISVTVTGARTYADAKLAARAIANSLLVKTAVHGGDPNWGRLIAAAGRSGAAFELGGARVSIGPVELFAQGRPFDERAPAAAEYLQGRDIDIVVDLGTGGHEDARVWTCDLSGEYVKINAEYRT